MSVYLRGQDVEAAIEEAKKHLRRDPVFEMIRGDKDDIWHAIGMNVSVMLTPDLVESLGHDPHILQQSVFQKLVLPSSIGSESMIGNPRSRERRALKINLPGDVKLYVIENTGDPDDVGNPAAQIILTTKTLNL